MKTPGDDIVARIAVERGFVTSDQLAKAVRLQADSDGAMLFDVLVDRKILDADCVQELRHVIEIAAGRARLIAGYEVISKLGQGGMGAVYKARKLDSGQIVALKLLPPSLADERTVARFKREFYAASHLEHPHIVGSVEFGFDNGKGVYYCALEYVEGENLGDRILRVGKIPEREAIDIARQIGMGLQHAHFSELIHRDVKPANIMITSDGVAKLLDLGLARSATSEVSRVTLPGAFVGTPHYVSPEQAVGRDDLDTRGDIYSLGATLYHMLTGVPPFDGNNSMVILQKHVTEMLPWPGDVVPELSDDICFTISKMMAKDPSDRYQTPKELVGDLDVLLSGGSPRIETSEIQHSSIKQASKALLSRKRRRRPPTQKQRRKRASTHGRFKPPSTGRPRPPSSSRIRPASRARASAARQQLADPPPPEEPPQEPEAPKGPGVWKDLVDASGEHLANLSRALRRYWKSLAPKTRLKVAVCSASALAASVLLLVIVIAVSGPAAEDDGPAAPPKAHAASEALSAVEEFERNNDGSPGAAIAGYEALLVRYPDSPEAHTARSRIAAIRAGMNSPTAPSAEEGGPR